MAHHVSISSPVGGRYTLLSQALRGIVGAWAKRCPEVRDAAEASATWPLWARSAQSAPALNVLPAPEMTATLLLTSSRPRYCASISAALRSRCMAVQTAAPLRVLTATWSARSLGRVARVTMRCHAGLTTPRQRWYARRWRARFSLESGAYRYGVPHSLRAHPAQHWPQRRGRPPSATPPHL